jgi:hypothetical protein
MKKIKGIYQWVFLLVVIEFNGKSNENYLKFKSVC